MLLSTRKPMPLSDQYIKKVITKEMASKSTLVKYSKTFDHICLPKVSCKKESVESFENNSLYMKCNSH